MSKFGRKSKFELLPVELVLTILGSVADIRSLTSTALSCSTIYQILIEGQFQVVPQVLFREIDTEVLPEAIAVLESFTSVWTKTAILNFAAETLDDRKTSERSWNLVDAYSVVRMFHQITGLATDFSSQSKTSRQIEGEASAPTKSELNRFRRSFYRFQLYCNLFGDLEHPTFSLQEQRIVFFSRFSPWENEQLACVHDYLCRLLSSGPFQCSSITCTRS